MLRIVDGHGVRRAGFCDGLGAGLVIGLPPVIRFAQSKELARRVGTEVLLGHKRIALAITDPGAGSDVAKIAVSLPHPPVHPLPPCLSASPPNARRTRALTAHEKMLLRRQATAVKTPCGKFFIVNGLKKWITNGTALANSSLTNVTPTHVFLSCPPCPVHRVKLHQGPNPNSSPRLLQLP